MPNRNEFQFEITYGPITANAAGEKEVLMTVTCRNKKGTLITNFNISVESGGALEQKKTDTKGTFQHTAKCPTGTNEITGKFLYKKGNADLEFPWKHDLTFPTSATAPTAVPGATTPPAPIVPPKSKSDSKDPVTITLTRYRDAVNSNFTVIIRVLGENGKGLSVKGVVEFSGSQKSFKTDSQGNATYSPITIPAGQNELVVKGIVSGITDPAILTLRNPRTVPTGGPTRWSRPWFYGTNNGRAVGFLTLMAIGWIFCWSIGWGEPLLGGHLTTLTEQQQLFNRLVTVVNPAANIAPEPSAGTWQHWAWGMVFLFTIFAVLYAPLSLREEIAEEIAEIFDRVVDRPYVKASDPLVERLMAWSGVRGISQQTPAHSPATTTDTAKPGADHGTSFWRLFKSDFLSEILTEVLFPAVFRAVARR